MEESELKSLEIWESTTGGTTYVSVKDPRAPGAWIEKKVGGKGSQKIQLTVEERMFNQDRVAYDNEHHCPFRNGLLVRIHPANVERGDNEVTDAQLVELLTDKEQDDTEFEAFIKDISSEVVLRRLLALARKHSSMWRYELIEDVVREKFAIGKSQLVYTETVKAGE